MNKIDWNKWSAIAEIFGAIAVLITLIYLSIQTRYLATQTQQNTAAIQASVRQEMFANDQVFLMNGMELRSCQVDALSGAWSAPACESMNLAALFRSRENNWLQYRDGVIDELTFESYNNATIQALCAPRIIELWPTLRRTLSNEFGEYIDQLRAELSRRDQEGSFGCDASQ